MICKKCSTINENKNKFCIKCCSVLSSDHSESISCPVCGGQNLKAASFCAECGNNLQEGVPSSGKKARVRQHKRSGKNKPKNLKFSSIISEHKGISAAIIILIGFLIYQSVPKSTGNDNRYYNPGMVEGSIVSAKSDSISAAVIKNFDCACGECNDPLDVCTCSTAAEERNYIQTKAVRNMSVDGIITAVINKYGGLKNSRGLVSGG